MAEAGPDEVIFLQGFRVEAPVVAHAKRNMKNFKGHEKAYKFLRKTGQRKGVIIKMEGERVVGAEHFELPD